MKNRRVGTFTLGVALIAVGVLIIASLLFDAIPILTVLKLSPVLLILFGAEILFYVFWRRDERLRYDGFSIFLCIVLVGGSLCTAAILPVAETVLSRRDAANELCLERRDALRSALRDVQGIEGDYAANVYPEESYDYYNPFAAEADPAVLSLSYTVSMAPAAREEVFPRIAGVLRALRTSGLELRDGDLLCFSGSLTDEELYDEYYYNIRLPLPDALSYDERYLAEHYDGWLPDPLSKEEDLSFSDDAEEETL